jgi:hypothetical protein
MTVVCAEPFTINTAATASTRREVGNRSIIALLRDFQGLFIFISVLSIASASKQQPSNPLFRSSGVESRKFTVTSSDGQ